MPSKRMFIHWHFVMRSHLLYYRTLSALAKSHKLKKKKNKHDPKGILEGEEVNLRLL